MKKVIVTMEGGLIQSILTNDTEIQVFVVDYDSEGADEDVLLTSDDVSNFVGDTVFHEIGWDGGVSEENIAFPIASDKHSEVQEEPRKWNLSRIRKG